MAQTWHLAGGNCSRELPSSGHVALTAVVLPEMGSGTLKPRQRFCTVKYLPAGTLRVAHPVPQPPGPI